MQVQPYREIESKDGLIPLFDHAFNWVFNEIQFNDFVGIDPRLRNGPVSFIGVENGKIVGHVGVMDLATRTIEGNVEYVGGIYGVATLAGYTRKGVCTTLMKKAHEYFREKDYPFSLLSTSPALIAHSLYEKMGYVDILEYPSAYKPFDENVARSSRLEKIMRFDLDKICRIYNLFVRGRTGLVVRDKAYFRMLKKVEGIKSRQCIVQNNGYAILSEDKTRTWIKELVALSQAGLRRLIQMVESRAKGPICDRTVLDGKLFETYADRGYITQNRGYGVMMCKSLAAGASFTEKYGDKFYMDRLDAF